MSVEMATLAGQLGLPVDRTNLIAHHEYLTPEQLRRKKLELIAEAA